MPKIYIPNKSFHDFSEAKQFGELVYLTRGRLKPLQVNDIARQVAEKMSDSGPDDYLLVSSLQVVNAIAAAILAAKHKRVNFLLLGQTQYVKRTLVLDEATLEVFTKGDQEEDGDGDAHT